MSLIDRKAVAAAPQNPWPDYEMKIADAGDAYIRSIAFDGKHTLPAMFRWQKLWDVMNEAARSGEDAQAQSWEASWQWWAGRDEEWLTVGPCPTRQCAIDEMVADGCAECLDESQDPPVWVNTFTVVEARQDPLRIADWIDADSILERAEENLADSDRVGCENDDGPWFEVSKEQESDLEARLRRACDEWQAAHGLRFESMTFSHTRNQEVVTALASRGIEGDVA